MMFIQNNSPNNLLLAYLIGLVGQQSDSDWWANCHATREYIVLYIINKSFTLTTSLANIHIDGQVHERCNSNALELRLSCTNPSICYSVVLLQHGQSLWGRDMGCLLSVLTLMYVLLWSLLCCMHYHIIWDRVITAPDFILVSICYYYSYSCSEFQLLYHLQPTFGAGSILEWVCSFTHSSIHSYISPSTHFILLCQHSACWWPSTVRYQQAYWWWLPSSL